MPGLGRNRTGVTKKQFEPLEDIHCFTERLGSGDGERKTLLTRQIAFEPLPASVLFAL
jgi:hypothetical protein